MQRNTGACTISKNGIVLQAFSAESDSGCAILFVTHQSCSGQLTLSKTWASSWTANEIPPELIRTQGQRPTNYWFNTHRMIVTYVYMTSYTRAGMDVTYT